MMLYIDRLSGLRRLALQLLALLGFGREAEQSTIEAMPIEDGGQTWYTIKEAAKLLGMSKQAVHGYIDRYDLEVKHVRGKTFAVPFATIAWIKAHNKR